MSSTFLSRRRPSFNLPLTRLLVERHSLGTSNLWFSGWTPTTVGGTFGSAVGLFFLAVFSRLLSTISTGLSKYWDQNVSDMRKQQIVEAKDLGYVAAPLEEGKQVPPFIFSHDVPRGIIFMLEGELSFLVSFSFQVLELLTIVLGE